MRWLIPAVLAVVGILLAVPSAIVAERAGGAAVGTAGLEAGAALWFAGAVTLGATTETTVRQVAVLAATAVAGFLLVATALLADFGGAALALSMEFGVGAIAVVVIDVLVLGLVHARVDWVARGMGADVLWLDLSWRWPPVRLQRERDAAP